MKIEIRNPVALRDEIEKVIRVHYGVQEHISFMKEYPEIDHIYRTLLADSAEAKEESKASEAKQRENNKHPVL